MRVHFGRLAIPLLAGACLLSGAPAQAADSFVRDEAGFFSPAALARAEEQIREIHRASNQDVLIETVAALSAEQEKERKYQGTTQFFSQWAKERVAAAECDGIYILICREPQFIQVNAGSEAEKAFPSAVRAELRRTLSRQFDKKHNDDGLLDAVGFIRSRLQPESRPARSAYWLWPVLIILGLLLAWVAIGVVRKVLGAGGPAVTATGQTDGFLVGMFGATAGCWLYQALIGGRCTQDTPNSEQEAAPPAAEPATEPGLPPTQIDGAWAGEPTRYDARETKSL
jgi:uncharacterized membrane protein YgcG